MQEVTGSIPVVSTKKNKGWQKPSLVLFAAATPIQNHVKEQMPFWASVLWHGLRHLPISLGYAFAQTLVLIPVVSGPLQTKSPDTFSRQGFFSLIFIYRSPTDLS